jgi:hypothetical protein
LWNLRGHPRQIASTLGLFFGLVLRVGFSDSALGFQCADKITPRHTGWKSDAFHNRDG